MVRNIPQLDIQADRIKGMIPGRFRGVVVSWSGGLDSTALLAVLSDFAKAEKNFPLAAFHVNYGLRGEASEADERFCRDLAALWDVPLTVRRVTAEERAARQGESIQEWARRLRRAELASWAADGWLIALGHHQDDLAETVLLRLARGASPGNLAGMQVFAPPYWRPFLPTPKAALAAYLADRGIPHREDASNGTLIYSRNVIRHEILPALAQLYPGATERIAACALEAQDLAAWCQEKLAGEMGDAPFPDFFTQKSPGLARLALATLINRLGHHRQLSRRLLDKILSRLRRGEAFVQELPRGGWVVLQEGRVSVRNAKTSVTKAARSRQHQLSLADSSLSALLEPGSYALFSGNQGVWVLDREFSRKGEPLSPELVRVYGAGARKTVRFTGSRHQWLLKRLYSAWGLDSCQRGVVRLVERNGETLGLYDGLALLTPRPDGGQARCQADFDLRYFKQDENVEDPRS